MHKFFRKLAGVAVGVLVALGTVGAYGERLVVNLVTDAATAWKPFLEAPRGEKAGTGVRFPLPFAGKADRAAWDRELGGQMDLSAVSGFALDFLCMEPSSMRHLGLYFRSGEGWYVCNRPLERAGEQRLVFHRSDFSIEGKPAGWGKVSAVRISAWRGDLGRKTEMVVHRLSALDGGLVLIQGTGSCKDAAEKGVARTAAVRVSKLLLEAGVGHRFVTDEEAAGVLSRADVRAALLPYNPHPAAAEKKALLAFLGRGGRLGVFYGADADLARAMGFTLGAWKREERPDQWRSMRFLAPMAGMPSVVAQHSTSLMPAFATGAGARTEAVWCDARGVASAMPAIVTSSKGFWMAHVLLGDDLTRKRDMLVTLCGDLDARVWEDAARHAARTAGSFPPYYSLNGALDCIWDTLQTAELDPAAPPGVAIAKVLFQRAEGLSKPIGAALEAGRFREAWLEATSQRRLLMRVDAMLQGPRPGEFAGIWDHDGMGWVPGDWRATTRQLAALGITAVFANMAWGGCAHFPSKVVPTSDTFRLYGDQLAAARAATTADGLQLHAWVVLWKLDGAPAEFVAKMRKEKRLLLDADGKETGWLDPHDLRNRQLMKDLIGEIAQNYPKLDGIHLDYVRLPGARAGITAAARERFEAAMGKKVAKWPADVLGSGPRAAEWRIWRTRDITRFVEDVRARLRRVAPGMKLSAAVYGTTDASDGGSIAQYWPPWLENGLVDFVTPMNYTESEPEFEKLLRRQTALKNAKGRIYPGIGANAIESRLDATQVARQILLARRYGCPGFVLFSLGATTRDEILPALHLGLLSKPR